MFVCEGGQVGPLVVTGFLAGGSTDQSATEMSSGLADAPEAG